MRETTWTKWETSKILELANSLGTYHSETFTIAPLADQLIVNVDLFSSSVLLDSFRYFFTCEHNLEYKQIRVYVSNLRIVDIPIKYREGIVIDTPIWAIIDESKTACIIIGESANYGLVKSSILGIYSSFLTESHYYPAHCSFIDHQGKGALFVGGHGAGKTTILLNLLHYYPKSLSILSDDWIVLSKFERSVIARPVERLLSFKEQHIQENPHLSLSSFFKENKREGIHKVYIPPSNVWGDKSFKESSNLCKIFLLDTSKKGALFFPIRRSEVVDSLISTAYHMPNCFTESMERLKSFWEDILSDQQIEFLGLNPREEANKEVLSKHIMRRITR